LGERDEQTGRPEFLVGDCAVRPDTNEIVRDGEMQHLEPKSMEILAYLIARPGEAVSREELLDQVWPDVHVGDDSLTAAIIKIRRALADDARDPQYVETIPKRGYRLIAPVREIGANVAEEDQPASSRGRRRRLHFAAFATLAAALVVVATAFYRTTTPINNEARTSAQSQDRVVIGVAPFTNASRDAAQDYLARGIADSILTDLAQAPDLAVRPYDPALAGDTSPDADYLLEGSVLRSGDVIRVDSRLMDVKSGQILYSLRFDRPFADLLTIEDEIRENVLEKLEHGISAAEHSRKARGYTENVAAYDLFLRAQRALLVRTRETNLAARTLYRQAIDKDPNFARAYGGLALTYAAEYRNGWVENRQAALSGALKYAKTAIGIAPDLPEQLWVVGYVNTQQRKYDEGRAALQKAIEIDPGFADAYALSGGIETYRGNPAETVPLLRKAIRLNPRAGYLYFLLLARAYYFLGDFEQAEINLKEALARNPQNVEAHLYRAATLLRLNQADDAAWEAEEVKSIEPDFNLTVWSAAYPMARGKQLDLLLRDLREAGFL
jgi:DNA-binding winged helix-turn-helix (wHTH) protein/TolB-like protein/Tfp pilus assembly protein PilF